jgi:hypothetical protein
VLLDSVRVAEYLCLANGVGTLVRKSPTDQPIGWVRSQMELLFVLPMLAALDFLFHCYPTCPRLPLLLALAIASQLPDGIVRGLHMLARALPLATGWAASLGSITFNGGASGAAVANQAAREA